MLNPLYPSTEDHVTPVGSDSNRRRALGIYYTPRSAAALLAKWAIRDSNDYVLEPSFGGCTILEAAVNQLRNLGCQQPSKQLYGFDVDESAFGHLRRVLGKSRHDNFALQDFLTVNPNRTIVDAVIANPPFISYHRMAPEQRESVRTWRSRYSPQFAMTASLWAYFLTHSMSFLRAGGRMAFVLPFAAYSSDYSQPILEMLQTRFCAVAVYRVRAQLFIQAGAEERTVILLADGYRDNSGVSSTRFDRAVEDIRELGHLLETNNSSDPLIDKRGPGTSISPEDPMLSVVSAALDRGDVVRLEDVVTTKIGEVVGDTRYFVKTREEWENLRIPEKYLHPLLTRMRQTAGIRLTKREATNLYGGIPLLLCPENSRSTRLNEYLSAYPTKLRLSNQTFAKRTPWYLVGYDTSASAFIGSMSHESPRIIWNTAKVSCGNGLYKLRIRSRSGWGSLLAAVSTTTLFKLSAELHGRVRGSGALKLEPADVAKLLIPARPSMPTATQGRDLVAQIDGLVRNAEHGSATRLADKAFFLDTGIFTSAELNLLRDRFHDLRRQRLPGIKA
jgi:adenine-specific DNA-methyltransferase